MDVSQSSSSMHGFEIDCTPGFLFSERHGRLQRQCRVCIMKARKVGRVCDASRAPSFREVQKATRLHQAKEHQTVYRVYLDSENTDERHAAPFVSFYEPAEEKEVIASMSVGGCREPWRSKGSEPDEDKQALGGKPFLYCNLQ